MVLVLNVQLLFYMAAMNLNFGEVKSGPMTCSLIFEYYIYKHDSSSNLSSRWLNTCLFEPIRKISSELTEEAKGTEAKV